MSKKVKSLIEKLHEQYTQPNLIQPTFITDFPTETSPLAKKRPDDPNLTRRLFLRDLPTPPDE